MAQKFDYLKSERQLREVLDNLYKESKYLYDKGERPSNKGLLELMSAETTIVTAIHNIKSNKGSQTAGIDEKTMQRDYLQKPYNWVISDIQNAFIKYKPEKIRRVYIDKPEKKEKRPLGIPTIRDRIVQECIKIIIEPILEAQFFNHSYGFRPMRDTKMALERITDLVHDTGYYWIVEGDISKCFDKINHGILIKRLYHMGIKDRRVLQIIKLMLKSGIIGECEINDNGTPQGGILSPLLSNAYMDIFDEWLSKQYENKTTKYQYKQQCGKIGALRLRSNLKPVYLVRYADDFCAITNSKENAIFFKKQISDFLNDRMKLTLSKEKTLITDVRKKYIKFLGYEYKMVKGKAKRGYVTRTIPNRVRLKNKVESIKKEIKIMPINFSREQAIDYINKINSKIRGLINYYDNCTWVYIQMAKYDYNFARIAMNRLKQYRGKWIYSNETRNLINVHTKYRQKIPSIKYQNIWIGITRLTFCKWQRAQGKKKGETPYTVEGRRIYFERTKKKRRHERLDGMLTERMSNAIANGSTKINKANNFEFYMNRAYALNRDRVKCRCCGKWLLERKVNTHRINPFLPLNKINKVQNLASMDTACFNLVNNKSLDINYLEPETRKKIESFRKKTGQITC